MRKISILCIFLLILPLLISCTEKIPEEETFTFELVGDSTVYIEEGYSYKDQGVMINGEVSTDIGYYSNVDTKKVGTYYVEFMHYDESLIRTVIVTEGAYTIYKRMIEELKHAQSFKYTQDLWVSYKNNGIEVDHFYKKSFDVYGDYAFGNSEYDSVHGSAELNEYTYINHESKKVERYCFDDYGYWYNENNFYETTDVAKTDFSLDYFSYVTRELIEEDYVYTVYLKPGGYDRGFYEYINYIDHVGLNNEALEPLKIVVYTSNNQISKIIIDLSQMIETHLNEPHTISDLSYVFTYEFSHINQLEPIVIPPEALATKN